ncbi:MAG: hypothetical protein ABIN89_24995 [Chitinophagaceae bacterium]
MPFPPGKTGFVTDRPSAGIWQGAITHFYNSFWIYFSANCQSRLQYSWAEGPVMIKRNGYYYYFPADDVTGGQ